MGSSDFASPRAPLGWLEGLVSSSRGTIVLTSAGAAPFSPVTLPAANTPMGRRIYLPKRIGMCLWTGRRLIRYFLRSLFHIQWVPTHLSSACLRSTPMNLPESTTGSSRPPTEYVQR